MTNEAVAELATTTARLREITRHRYTALVVAALVSLVAGLAMSSMNVVFPLLEDDFPTVARGTLAWGIIGYSIVMASAMLFAGRLADTKGRLRLLKAGLVTFGIGSALTAAAPVVGWLLAGRAVQALGAALMAPASLALVLPRFPAERKGGAIAVWAAVGYLGSATAPTIISVVGSLGGWRAVFWTFAGAATLMSAVAPVVLTDDGARLDLEPLDRIGAIAGTIGLGLATFATAQAARHGLTNGTVLLSTPIVAGLGTVFVRRSLRRPGPLVELRHFRPRAVWASVLGTMFMGVSGFGTWVLYPLLMKQHWGWSTRAIGAGLTPLPLAAGFATLIWARLAGMFGQKALLRASCVVMAAGQLWFVFFLRARVSYWSGLLPGGVIYNMGFGLTYARLHAAALTGVPEAALGSASASFSTARQFANGLGAAVTVAILGDAVVIAEPRFRLALVTLATCSGATVVVIWALLREGITLLRTPQSSETNRDLAL